MAHGRGDRLPHILRWPTNKCLIRSCTVRTATTELQRPGQMLCVLPVRTGWKGCVLQCGECDRLCLSRRPHERRRALRVFTQNRSPNGNRKMHLVGQTLRCSNSIANQPWSVSQRSHRAVQSALTVFTNPLFPVDRAERERTIRPHHEQNAINDF